MIPRYRDWFKGAVPKPSP